MLTNRELGRFWPRGLKAMWLAGLAAAIVLGGLTAFVAKPPGLPDFSAYEAGPERKAEFLAFLEPLIQAENRAVLTDRELLEDMAARSELGWLDRYKLRRLADEYALDADEVGDADLIAALLRRADIVPISIALAQAAKESGWGTSRFARQGNNLFGEWCYDPGCGLVPRERPEGRRYEVEAFATARDSVESYLRNINTHEGYRDFRRERARLREAGRTLSGLLLAEQLASYSERRGAYVNDIKRLIQFNDLTQVASDRAD